METCPCVYITEIVFQSPTACAVCLRHHFVHFGPCGGWQCAVAEVRPVEGSTQHGGSCWGGTCESIHSTLHNVVSATWYGRFRQSESLYVMTPGFGVESLIDILLVKSVWVNSVLSLVSPPSLLCVHVESYFMCRCSSMWLSGDWPKHL